jgi:hypothetical protein
VIERNPAKLDIRFLSRNAWIIISKMHHDMPTLVCDRVPVEMKIVKSQDPAPCGLINRSIKNATTCSSYALGSYRKKFRCLAPSTIISFGPGCSCSCTRPATASQRRDFDSPSGLKSVVTSM